MSLAGTPPPDPRPPLVGVRDSKRCYRQVKVKGTTIQWNQGLLRGGRGVGPPPSMTALQRPEETTGHGRRSSVETKVLVVLLLIIIFSSVTFPCELILICAARRTGGGGRRRGGGGSAVELQNN